MTYSNSLSIGRQRFASRGRNTTSFQAKETTLGPITNTVMLIILICLLGLLYLTQVTKTNAHGYKINELEKQQTQLNEQHGELEVAAARLQAVDRVKNSKAAKNLVSVTPTATIQN